MKLGVKMIINVKNMNINYIQYGEGHDVVLLHGWGQNIEMMRPLGDRLQKNHRITIIDLPGFGQSSEPDVELTIYDYCDVVEQVLKKLKVKNPVMIGHSFGGRISIIYASRNKCHRLVLFGSPCVREEEKESLKVKMLKSLKKVPFLRPFEDFAKKHIGSRDYRNASVVMRKVLVNTVNEDLSDCAKKIECPTLLIWGDNDTEEPVSSAKKMEALLQDGALIILPNSTHYAYLENLVQVVNIINNFI